MLDRGLQHALDSWKYLSNTKIHFVLIDFVQGQYEISAREYDGTTGLASPVVRQVRKRAIVSSSRGKRRCWSIAISDSWERL